MDTQDQIVPEENDKAVDRKELLSQQFDDIGTEDSSAPRAQDGKFVAAKSAPEAAPEAEDSLYVDYARCFWSDWCCWTGAFSDFSA